MPPTTIRPLNVDLTRIENAEVRRAVLQLIQQLQEIISQQQLQLDALLELMLDKNISSIGEYRRHLQRIVERGSDRSGRLHGQIAELLKGTHTGLEAPLPGDMQHGEDTGRRVYRL